MSSNLFLFIAILIASFIVILITSIQYNAKIEQQKEIANNTTFDNKELIKIILENNKEISINDFLKNVVLCDRLKSLNKKIIFNEYFVIFNGSMIKACKIQDANVISKCFDISSKNFSYYSCPHFERGNLTYEIEFNSKMFSDFKMQISEENNNELESHIKKIKDYIKNNENKISVFASLRNFDFQNFFENDKIHKIIKILMKDIIFFNRVKDTNCNFSNEMDIYNYYIYLEKELKKLEDEKERQRIVEEERQKRIFEKKYTKENSVLYSKLLELNQEYKNKENSFITNVCKKHLFEIECKSKTEFDRFDFSKKIIEEIKKDTSFYYSFPEVIKEAEDNYEWYLKKYNNLINQYSIKEDDYKFDIDYDRFKLNENNLCNEIKMNLLNYPTIEMKIHYTTPSFRYSYENKKVYEYREILTLIEKSKEPTKSELRQQNEKSLRDEIKYLKEQLSLVQQNQIYSQQKEEQQRVEINSNNSISLNLKHFRTLYENGEISKEEYEQKRKELMG